MIVGIIFVFTIIGAYFYKLWKQRKQISEIAEEKWETGDMTVYATYGKYEIPMLQSQIPVWEQMTEKERFYMLTHLKEEVKGKRLTVEKIGDITRFTGITEKAKDIKHRQKQRTEGWK